MSAVIVHEVPCRLRFRVQGLKHENGRATLIRDCMAAVPGVVAASASPLTGSVIVTHDGQAATRARITAALEACGHAILPNAPALAPAAIPLRDVPARDLPLLRILAEALVERLVHTAVAAVI